MARKGQSTKVEGISDAEKPRRRSKAKTGSPNPDGGETTTYDPYHSGSFCFATQDDQQRAFMIQKRSPDEIMDAYENGIVSLNDCAHFKICWNPGKKGITRGLEQGRFSIKDTILTRQQLTNTTILTRRAAECIVDFCPDLLWREMLLRIASEAGFGNKDVRDRMCHNGNYCDKATITKRIGSALGQKQQQSTLKSKKQQVEAEAADISTGEEQRLCKGRRRLL